MINEYNVSQMEYTKGRICNSRLGHVVMLSTMSHVISRVHS